ncbi:hypothetical protein Acr_00g0046910 [Actinidia rufa]|uniref:Uncharacterized protein n=1 Tax=Actinidia rufa TaxID=165716 RepID=A0A7J0DJK1_9ERIC|nr:hypothetical protein Acr_00g0046910 [Actinidia rufa]
MASPMMLKYSVSGQNENVNLVWGSHPGSYLVAPLGRALVPNYPNTERGDGGLPPYLHAGVYQLCPNCACGGHFDAPNEAPLQCREPFARLHHGTVIGSSELGTMVSNRSQDFNDQFKCQSKLIPRSPSQLRLALRISRRSILEGVRMCDTLRLVDTTDLLSLWLSRLMWDPRCLLFRPARGLQALDGHVPAVSSSGSNQLGFCLEATLAVLWASSSSLALLP